MQHVGSFSGELYLRFFYLEVSVLAMRPQTTQSIISLTVTISL